MRILQISAHYSPNIGGVETHLHDLVNGLIDKGNDIFVLTYRPLTSKVSWKCVEKKDSLTILRLPWISGLFNRLVDMPLIEFIYLSIGLFIACPIILLYFKPSVIHSHGIVAGFVGGFWGKIFRIKSVVSLHSIYNFPTKSIYTSFVSFILNQSSRILCLSDQSVKETRRIVNNRLNVRRFTYWIDTEKFNLKDKKLCRSKTGLPSGINLVLFVGRLVPEKGIVELINASKKFNKEIKLVIVGSGQLSEYINKNTNDQVIFLGSKSQDDLPYFYSAADLLIVPSTHEEGFGRVILESLASGTPILGSDRGAIPEAIDDSVGRLFSVSSENISREVNSIFSSNKIIVNWRRKCRQYALDKYSVNNLSQISSEYSS